MASRTTARIAFIGAATAALIGATVGTASAAPITCPGGQTAEQVAPSSWQCVNNGGNQSNAEDPKNPNADKSTF